MSLNGVIRSGLRTIDSLTGSLQTTVMWSPWILQAGDGGEEHQDPFGSPTPLQAIVELKRREQRTGGGSGLLVLTFAYIIFPRPFGPVGVPGRREPIDPRDRIVLADGSTGPIVDINGFIDADTSYPYFGEVWLGDATQRRQGF